VPDNGGRFTIRGFELWTDAGPPRISILNADRTKELASLKADPGSSADVVSAVLPKETVDKNAGSCLDLKVIVSKRQGFLHLSTVPTELHMPICVPQEYMLAFKLVAHQFSQNTNEQSGTTPPRHILYYNNECRNVTVSDDYYWGPKEGVPGHGKVKIYDEHATPDRQRHGGHLDFKISGDQITHVEGSLDGASCAPIRGMYESTIWEGHVVADYKVTDIINEETQGASDLVAVTLPESQICVDVPKNQETPDTQWWFILTAGSKTSPRIPTKTLFESPRLPSSGPTGVMETAHRDAYSIRASINAVPRDGKAQVCAVVTVPDQCRF
jgi:hypothetical protein